MNRATMRIFIRTFGPQNEYNNKTHYTMRKLLTLISMLLALVSSATAGVIVTDYLTAQKGSIPNSYCSPKMCSISDLIRGN